MSVNTLRACLSLTVLAFLSPAVSAQEPEVEKVIATFSIVAVDPETGEVGAAVASKYPAVGKVVPMVEAGVGAICTQHYGVPEWRAKALQMLRDKATPEEVVAALLKSDDRPEQRQLAVIDAQGRIALHHPTQAPERSQYWGGMSGRFYSCQGNTLTGPEVIIAMANAYEETKGTLADRLMASLVAGDEAGGDHRGRLAAGIRVAKSGDNGFTFELDIDDSNDAVRDLAKKYAETEHPAKGK